MDNKSKKQRAAERVEKGLDEGVPADRLDRADTERVADATSSPQPEPAQRKSADDQDEGAP